MRTRYQVLRRIIEPRRVGVKRYHGAPGRQRYALLAEARSGSWAAAVSVRVLEHLHPLFAREALVRLLHQAMADQRLGKNTMPHGEKQHFFVGVAMHKVPGFCHDFLQPGGQALHDATGDVGEGLQFGLDDV